MKSEKDLFASGERGYHTYRIPSLLLAANGDVLAFCEGRTNSSSDRAKIDILMRRSSDGGMTWSDMSLVAAEEGMTCGNNCPVVDQRDGKILLLFCKNPADVPKSAIIKQEALRTVWITGSYDNGRTWSETREITPNVKKNLWNWYATGPGHAIQLASGRLLIPCNHNVLVHGNDMDPYHSHVIYSDDRGKTWQIGGQISLPSNENCLVELGGGNVYMNCRTRKDKSRRVGAFSRDGGITFMEEFYHEELPEPTLYAGGCEGSLVRLSENAVLFCNPATSIDIRCRLTVRISSDGCRSFGAGRILCEGLSAYSDMVVLSDQTVLCLYERGEKNLSEFLTLARFDLDWLCENSSKTK